MSREGLLIETIIASVTSVLLCQVMWVYLRLCEYLHLLKRKLPVVPFMSNVKLSVWQLITHCSTTYSFEKIEIRTIEGLMSSMLGTTGNK